MPFWSASMLCVPSEPARFLAQVVSRPLLHMNGHLMTQLITHNPLSAWQVFAPEQKHHARICKLHLTRGPQSNHISLC
ncbi:hypothetical protein LZ32DRAFT_341486 [Colletotrichum eremochloae]|nr:hypothetical protein LZ32DRAFT_341486 [Colletotrichum eremochloae]